MNRSILDFLTLAAVCLRACSVSYLKLKEKESLSFRILRLQCSNQHRSVRVIRILTRSQSFRASTKRKRKLLNKPTPTLKDQNSKGVIKISLALKNQNGKGVIKASPSLKDQKVKRVIKLSPALKIKTVKE